jgi:hypothetical protein
MTNESDTRRQYIERLINVSLAQGLAERRKAIAANDQRRREDVPPPRESTTRAIDGNNKPIVA